MKRCYGCGKLIWPWQDILNTEKLNPIHKMCLIPAYLRYILIGKKIHNEYMKEAYETLGAEKEKDKINVGDIRIDPCSKEPQVCVKVEYHNDGSLEVAWSDYKTDILHFTTGMCPHCHTIYPLERFKEGQELNFKEKDKKEIKIRYAYISSPTTMRIDPAYCETLEFGVLTVAQLESQKESLNDMLTLDTTALIRILGRDRYTGWNDKEGREIYEGDIIRWFFNDGGFYDEVVDRHSPFDELESERDCKVIGTVYGREQQVDPLESKPGGKTASTIK